MCIRDRSIGSVVSGTTYPSDDPELVAVEADYAAKETALQAEIDNIESSQDVYKRQVWARTICAR